MMVRFLFLIGLVMFLNYGHAQAKHYIAELNGYFVLNGEVQQYNLPGFEVILDEIEKEHVDFNGNVIQKKGRQIYGDLNPLVFEENTGRFHMQLKRRFFGRNYHGDFQTCINCSRTNFNDCFLTGTIRLKPVN